MPEKPIEVQFRVDSKSNGKNQILAINTEKSRTGSTILINHVSNQNDDYKVVTGTFTAPTSGGYYLLMHTLQTNYVKQYVDEVRIIGNINRGPSATITLPAKDATVAQDLEVTFNADATDEDGTITNVIFKANGTVIGSDNSAPYSVTWTASTPGTYEITATSIDSDNGEGFSKPITVTVDENRLSASSYLGGSGDDDAVRGAVIEPDGKIVLAANIGNKTFSGITATNLNGSTSSTSGAIIRLSADGQTVLSVTRLASHVNDIANDNNGNLYVACGADGVIKLNSTATSLNMEENEVRAAMPIG